MPENAPERDAAEKNVDILTLYVIDVDTVANKLLTSFVTFGADKSLKGIRPDPEIHHL